MRRAALSPAFARPLDAVGAWLDGEPVGVRVLVHLDVGDERVQLLHARARGGGTASRVHALRVECQQLCTTTTHRVPVPQLCGLAHVAMRVERRGKRPLHSTGSKTDNLDKPDRVLRVART